MTQNITRAYGDMLDRQWDYFTTLSFKHLIKEHQNRKIMDRHVNTLYLKDKPFEMFWVSEWHRSGSSVHNHLLVKGDITQEQFDKLIEQKRVATVESMKKNNEKIKKVMDENNKILEKTSIKQVEKINELVELMKDNKKLVAEKENQTASFVNTGGNTNITTNPSEQTIVMDKKITDSFHSRVVRPQFG